jgi:hypothetical protein
MKIDTQTLGGAGFASQRFTFGPIPLHLPPLEYQGLSINYLSSRLEDDATAKPPKPHTYTITLKTTQPTYYPPPGQPKPPKTPEPAVLSYEYSFDTSSSSSGLKKPSPISIELPFGDFVPTYRGREVKKDNPIYRPLQTETIYEFSLMCRSGFGEQEGEFELIILGIDGWRKETVRGARESLGGIWNGLVDMCRGFWSWLCALGGREEGMVRLSDNEKL